MCRRAAPLCTAATSVRQRRARVRRSLRGWWTAHDGSCEPLRPCRAEEVENGAYEHETDADENHQQREVPGAAPVVHVVQGRCVDASDAERGPGCTPYDERRDHERHAEHE